MSLEEEKTLAFIADNQFDGSYFDVFCIAWEFSNGTPPTASDERAIERDLGHFLNGIADMPVYLKLYLRQRGCYILPA